jgi:hypothetical protein
VAAAGARSRRRRLVFRLVAAVVVPAVVLGVLELILRLGGAHTPPAFLIEDASFEGASRLRENPRFGERYFPEALARRPAPLVLTPKERGAPPWRVFVLGGSAALGDPEPAFGLPRMLQATLEARVPSERWEVVCAAMTAINSHVLVDIAADVLARGGADALVVYAGNNEVVGPFGVGTVLGGAGSSRTLVRASLAARRSAIGQMLASLAGGDAPAPSWRGMEMFLEQRIAADDPGLDRVVSSLRANLDAILDHARAAGVPVIVCTPLVNLSRSSSSSRRARRPEPSRWPRPGWGRSPGARRSTGCAAARCSSSNDGTRPPLRSRRRATSTSSASARTLASRRSSARSREPAPARG